jgi:hypothetical protein
VSFEFPDGLRPLVPGFPHEIAGDGVLVRTPTHGDVPLLAPAFRDPAVGGEAGLPLFGEEEIHTFIDDQLPLWRASGQLVPHLVIEAETGGYRGGRVDSTLFSRLADDA